MRDVSKSNGGQYRCVAKNKEGHEVDKTVEIIISGDV